MKNLAWIALSVVLGLAASPTFAQIHVDGAKWGLAGPNGRVTARNCDARTQLVRACDGRRSCQLLAENRVLCGDPAQGNAKALEVSYSCAGFAPQVLSFPEHAQVVLNCDKPPIVEHDRDHDRDRPSGRGMRLESAVWGAIEESGRVERDACNASEMVARRCEGRRSCVVRVENAELCGDPAHNREKTLEVSYSCGREMQTYSFPEDAQAELSCDANMEPRDPGDRALNILSARWGVAGPDGRVERRACNAAAEMANACNGKEQCQVSMYNRYLCGDPAPGEHKALEVVYSCGARREMLSFPETAQAILKCQ